MNRTTYIAQAGVIAAVYAVLTIPVVQLGSVFTWGPLQFRPSRPSPSSPLTPAGIPGVWLGAVIANGVGMTQTGAFGLLDVVFGSPRLAARRRLDVALPSPHADRARSAPVIANALIVPAYLPLILKRRRRAGHLQALRHRRLARVPHHVPASAIVLIGGSPRRSSCTPSAGCFSARCAGCLPWLMPAAAEADDKGVS